MAIDKERAKKLEEIAQKTNAILRGVDVVLSSGKRSTFYFDGKMVTLSPEGAYEVGKAIFEEIKNIEIDGIGGPAIGAIPIATAVSLISFLKGRPIPSFVVREKPKEHGRKRKIEGHLEKGSRVVIVDDVITTGGSIRKAIEAVEEENCRVVKVIALVDRGEGGSDWLKRNGYDFVAFLKLDASGEVIAQET